MAAAVAIKAVVAEAPKVVIHPPSSPFSELLRRSKFATYDPKIRQTYSSPPANTHRGDWGLKRPIALRRKDAFITLKSFEDHAQFIEWDRSEDEVRFIRRVEEMGVHSDTVINTAWDKALGSAARQPLLDSDFCPGEDGNMAYKKEEYVDPNLLGRKGPGGYGARRVPPPGQERLEAYVTQNIDAMSKREFDRYIARLRRMRPLFQAHVNANATTIPSTNLYTLAQKADGGYHRRFMMEHMTNEYREFLGHKIEPQPHPNAALMYAHPTPFETKVWTKPKSAIFLHEVSTSRVSKLSKQYIASYGGLSATISSNDIEGKNPLLNFSSEVGINREEFERSVLQLRIAPRGGLKVAIPPATVADRPTGLSRVKITAQALRDDGITFETENPYPLGSMEYVAKEQISHKAVATNFAWPSTKKYIPKEPLSKASAQHLLGTLKGMMINKKEGDL